MRIPPPSGRDDDTRSGIARELRLEKSDATLLRPVDTILLALVAIVTLAITIWVEVL